MDNCDVLIVGGGPAGSTCAWQLREQGLDVMILDKQTFPRNKVCAGWITPAVLESLQIDLDDYRKDGRTLQPLSGFRTGMLGQADVLTDYGEPVSYGILRREFDDYLLQRSGARLRLGEGMSECRRDGDLWIINESIRTRLLIGAGGHFCPVARLLGAKPGSSEAAVRAQETEFLLTPEQQQSCPVRADTPELFFCEDLKGYGWIFRKGDYLNIGLGRQDNSKLTAHVDTFIDYLKQRGRIPEQLPQRMQGHAYLLYGDTPRKVIDDQVLLIGDAAGLAYTQSGEGIRPAIESALMAADVIEHAEGDYHASQLQPYLDRLTERFGARSHSHSLQLPEWFKLMAGRHLMRSKWFARNFVLDRWFFHRNQPAMKPAVS